MKALSLKPLNICTGYGSTIDQSSRGKRRSCKNADGCVRDCTFVVLWLLLCSLPEHHYQYNFLD